MIRLGRPAKGAPIYLLEDVFGKMAEIAKCPRCGKENVKLDALSRKDNKTMICSNCGTQEAIEDYVRFREGK